MSKPLIMIVDDDKGMVHLFALMIKNLDCEIIEAVTGKQAIEILSEVTPDLLILDLVMSPTTGADVLHFVRSVPRLTPMKVMMLSAGGKKYAYLIDAVERLGYDCWLTKPVQQYELANAVKELLPEISMPRELAPPTSPLPGAAKRIPSLATENWPTLTNHPRDAWPDTIRTTLDNDESDERGLAVMALAEWQKEDNAPFSATEGQRVFWEHVRHKRVSQTVESAREHWATLAPVALALMQPADSMAMALKALLPAGCGECRQWALRILRVNEDPDAAALAIQALKDDDSEVRGTAINILSEIGSEDHVLVLVQSLNDPEPGVREQTAKALAIIGGEMGQMALIAALEDGGPEAAEVAAGALALRVTENAVDALVRASQARDEEAVLRQVAYALNKNIKNEWQVERCTAEIATLKQRLAEMRASS